mgnify:CR=1 FL=1
MKIKFNEVTWYSKLVAIIVFLCVFAIAFYLGKEFGKLERQTIPADEPEAIQQEVVVRTDADRQAAIEKIRSLFGQDLTVTYSGSETKYYSYGIPDPAIITDFTQLKTIETYADSMGFTIKIDAANNEILSKAKDCAENGHAITNEEAKIIAKSLLAKITGNSDAYELTTENKGSQIYNSVWRLWHNGEAYNAVPEGKNRDLARMEEKTIAICLKSGELMSYENKPALTDTELAGMKTQWDKTQEKDTEALRMLPNKSDAQFTFVNWIAYGTKQREIINPVGEAITETYDYETFRVYMDEDGYCYDVGDDGSVFPNTEMARQCKTIK